MTFHTTIEVYNLRRRQTIEVLPLGIPPTRAFAAVSSGDDITVAGGLGPKGFADLRTHVLTFSTSHRKWTKLFDMPTGRFSPGLVWPRHAPLIVGGLYVAPDYSDYEEFDDIGTHDPHGGGWQEIDYLSSPRTFAEGAVHEDQVLVFGGHSGKLPTPVVECFDLGGVSALKSTRLQFFRNAWQEA